MEVVDAARIVAAVNHAESLAATLRSARAWVVSSVNNSAPDDAVYDQQMLDEIDAVLADYDAAKEAQP